MDMVHAQRIPPFYQTQKIIHVATAIAMVETHPRRIYALIFQDGGMVLTGAMGRIGMSAYRYTGRFAGLGRRAQTDLFQGCWAIGNNPYLDHAGLDAGAI